MKKRKRKRKLSRLISPLARKPLKKSAALGERAPLRVEDPLGIYGMARVVPLEKKRKRKKM